jgi:hypothetical protein
MTDRYQIITELEALVNSSDGTPDKFNQLRHLARDSQWLTNFDKSALERLVRIYLAVDDSSSQLAVVAALANILYKNPQLRNDDEPDALKLTIVKLYSMLDLVSERRFNSESQYHEFLPIFRLYFFLTQNRKLLPVLRDSILKIGGKLLNFVTLSSLESTSLNSVIVEILKILYSDVHQLEDTTGIDSYYVLSCNKFNLLYAKYDQTTKDYDQILEHFGNVLMAISTDVSQNYMLNKLQFVRNQVRYLNKILQQELLTRSIVPQILTLDLLLQIDAGESGLEKYIKENLNFDRLHALEHNDPHLPIVISELNHKLHNSVDLSAMLDATTQYQHQAAAQENGARPRFEDLTEEEQDNEIHKMQELFEKIEKNGVFNIKMS